METGGSMVGPHFKFKCELCAYSAMVSSRVANHVNEIHPEPATQSTTTSTEAVNNLNEINSEPPTESPTTDNIYCDEAFCYYKTKLSSNMNKHKRIWIWPPTV